jgi:hypothetical protein
MYLENGFVVELEMAFKRAWVRPTSRAPQQRYWINAAASAPYIDTNRKKTHIDLFCKLCNMLF